MDKIRDIKNTFIRFFENKNHKLLPPSKLVTNDESILFTNSGMVQFKNILLGLEEPEYKQVITIQPCLRAGGKHNDFEQVGNSNRHHTFFEMMGNWTFDAQDKKHAIENAWELLTEVWKISKEKLFISVHENDDEVYDIWVNLGIPETKIVRLTTDNFWQMGDNGPCGMSTEIFYGHGKDYDDNVSHIFDADRFVEIWNIVFIEYEMKDNELIKLNKLSIDTGIGLERLTAVLENVSSNYKTSIFIDMKSCLRNIVDDLNEINANIIVDHIRAIIFLISDGIMPSNKSHGYILRRLIRRAIKGGIQDSTKPFLYQMVYPVLKIYKTEYPHLYDVSFVEDIVKHEEIKYIKLLNSAENLILKHINKGNIIDGRFIFKLYETYGIPSEISLEICKKYENDINMQDYDVELSLHKKLSNMSNN